jgi:periplasmic divalent cation tolerance protein
MAFILVYVTHPDTDCARRIAKHLLEKRLVACANVFPIESMYWWVGRLEEKMEVVTLFKAPKRNWARLKAEIERLHPYDTPCIMRLDAKANAGFERWVGEVTQG